MKWKLAIVLSLFISTLSFAEAPVKVVARALPTRVTLGDEIKLYVQVDRPKNFTVTPLSPKIDLSPFEVKQMQSSLDLKKGRTYETFVLTLTIFELGDFSIRPIVVQIKDAAGAFYDIPTEAVPIKVVSVPKRPGDGEDIRPIKGPVSLDKEALRFLLMGLLAAVLTAALALKIYLRKRKKALIDLESLKPPHERAFLELGRLRQKDYISSGKLKEHYSELSDILRRYLERRFKIQSFELTTFELLNELKKKDFERSLSEKIKEVLEKTDLVKFAKYVPAKTLSGRLEEELVLIVESTKPEEVILKNKVQI